MTTQTNGVQKANSEPPSLEAVIIWLEYKLLSCESYRMNFDKDSIEPDCSDTKYFKLLLKEVTQMKGFIEFLNNPKLTKDQLMSELEDYLYEHI